MPTRSRFSRSSILRSRVRSDASRFGVSRTTMSRVSWDFRRFGITPHGLAGRVLPSDRPEIFCNSVQKSGTHLVERALCLNPTVFRRLLPTLLGVNLERWGGFDQVLARQRPGELLVGHLEFSEERAAALETSGAKSLFVIRDPRDIVISMSRWAAMNPAHNLHGLMNAQPTERDRIEVLIEGEGPRVPGIATVLESFEGWLDRAPLVLRFEELTGERQLETLRELFSFGGLPTDERWVGEVAGQLVSPASLTFRRGASGGWRDAFDSRLRALFKQHAGELLIRYGYETDLDW